MPKHLIAGSTLCGSRLGFPASAHCLAVAASGSPWCDGHASALAAIDRREKEITVMAERALFDPAAPVIESLQRLSSLSRTSRAEAVSWWRRTGVRQVSAPLRRRVLTSGPCVYCGDPNPTCIDHIIPVARGGLSVWWNLAAACKCCNDNKLDFTPNEWREWLRSEGQPWPPLSRAQQLHQIWSWLRRKTQGDSPNEH